MFDISYLFYIPLYLGSCGKMSHLKRKYLRSPVLKNPYIKIFYCWATTTQLEMKSCYQVQGRSLFISKPLIQWGRWMNKCPWTIWRPHALLWAAGSDTNLTGQCEVFWVFVQCRLWNVKVSEIHIGLSKGIKPTFWKMDISYLSRVLVLWRKMTWAK